MCWEEGGALGRCFLSCDGIANAGGYEGLGNEHGVQRRPSQQLIPAHEEVEAVVTEDIVCPHATDLTAHQAQGSARAREEVYSDARCDLAEDKGSASKTTPMIRALFVRFQKRLMIDGTMSCHAGRLAQIMPTHWL